MNNTRNFIIWVMIVLIADTVVRWFLEILQIRLYVTRQPVDGYLISIAALILLALFGMYKSFRLVLKMVFSQPFIKNHELLASSVVAFFLINFNKPVQYYSDFITFVAGLAVLIIALIMAKDATPPNREGVQK